MSQWTHVAGIIRLDSMGSAMVRGPIDYKQEKIKEAVAKALGNTATFDPSAEEWEKCSVPRGSEGSLDYNVASNTDKDDHSLSWGYVAIWGDLRDFGTEDVPGIQDWFQKSLERLQKPEGLGSPKEMGMSEKAEYMLSSFMIRDAVLSIDVENNLPLILLWDGDAKKVIKFQ